jgi:hypothetical protein
LIGQHDVSGPDLLRERIDIRQLIRRQTRHCTGAYREPGPEYASPARIESTHDLGFSEAVPRKGGAFQR